MKKRRVEDKKETRGNVGRKRHTRSDDGKSSTKPSDTREKEKERTKEEGKEEKKKGREKADETGRVSRS